MAAGLSACAGSGPSAETQTVRILTGTQGGAYYLLGSAFAGALARKLPLVQTRIELTDGSIANIDLIETGQGEVAIAQSDAIYSAFGQGTDARPQPHTRLRAIARLHPNTVHIVVRDDSPIRSVADLAGRRVGINDPGAGTASRTMRQVMEAHGIPFDRLPPQSFQGGELLQRLREGKIDAAVAVSGYPVPVISEIANASSVRLIELDPTAIHEIRSRFPFFRPVTIPAGTYRDQHHSAETVGIDVVLICSDTLAEQTAYDLTRTFFESLPEFPTDVPGVGFIDTEHAPATPIPLHPGAARYYRERELFR